MIKLRRVLSGIHIEPFYKDYYLPQFNLQEKLWDGYHDVIIPDFIIQEKAKENYDVADFDNDEEEMLWTVRNTIIDDALMYNWVYAPRVYNEEVAHLCHLIPFRLITSEEDYELLSFGGCGMDMTYKLEAYQLLADDSYDANSNFAKQGIKYFEYYYGKESGVLQEIKKRSDLKIAG
jgi:hypothetical protein